MVKNRREIMADITLLGKIIVSGKIRAETGQHIGGAKTGIDIGGVDNSVIKDQDGKPFIPGSSLKGKMRSLLEKDLGLAADNLRVWVKKPEVSIHMCNVPECVLCNIFGRNNGVHKKFINEVQFNIDCTTPTRIIVRDAFLIKESIPAEVKKNLDLEWTEVKWENVLDRITSAATPRQTERVPAGAEFKFEIIYNVLEERDKGNLKQVFKAMKLLEDDYLGGQGSRGYGEIKFIDLKVYWNSKNDYEQGTIELNDERKINDTFGQPSELLKNFEVLKTKIK